MKSFKWLLTEGRIEWLKDNTPHIDSSHDTTARHRVAADIIDHFATHADPTNKKIHTQWIVNGYKNQEFRQEDAPRVKAALEGFETHKESLPHQDINKYKLHGLEDDLEKVDGTSLGKNAQVRKIKETGATKIHDENGVTVHQLHTKEASDIYGAGTKWCTTGQMGNIYFHEYSSKGPLFVINTPNHGKFQYHPATRQLMDAPDNEVDAGLLVKKVPELRNVQAFQGTKVAFTKHIEDHIPKLMKNDPEGMRIHATPEQFEQAFHNIKNKTYSSEYDKNSDLGVIAQHGKFSDKFIHEHIIKPAPPSPGYDYVKNSYAVNQSASHEHLKELAKLHPLTWGHLINRPDAHEFGLDKVLIKHALENSNAKDYQRNAVLANKRHPVSSDVIQHMVDSPDLDLNTIAVRSHWDKMTPASKAKYMTHEDPKVRSIVASNSNDPLVLHTIYRIGGQEPLTSLARRTFYSDDLKGFHKSIHKGLLYNKSKAVSASYITNHPGNLNKEDTHYAVERHGIDVISPKNRHLLPQHVDQIIQKSGSKIWKLAQVATRSKLEPHHLDAVLAKGLHLAAHQKGSSGSAIITQLARRQDLQPHHIDKIVDSGSAYTVNNLLKFNKKNITPAHVAILSKHKSKVVRDVITAAFPA